MSCIGTAKQGSHIIAVYHNAKEELDEAFEFLKQGWQKSEFVMLITDMMSKDEILDRIGNDWNVDSRKLESDGDLVIKSTKEWYFPDGVARPEAIGRKWTAIASMVSMKGKNGLRVFGDMTGFFAAGLSKELVEYEASLPGTFQIPLTAICSYSVEEIAELEPESVEKVVEHHGVMWA